MRSNGESYGKSAECAKRFVLRFARLVGYAGLLCVVACSCAGADEDAGKKAKPEPEENGKDAQMTQVPDQDANTKSALVARLQKAGFAHSADSVYTKASLSVKELKDVLGVPDLQRAARPPSAPVAGPAIYILRMAGMHCVIETADQSADLLDDDTIVKVTVNVGAGRDSSGKKLTSKLTPAQKRQEKKK